MRRLLLAALGTAALVAGPRVPACAQAGIFLSEEEAPHAVFPEADRVVRHVVEVDPELRRRLGDALGGTRPSVQEERYVVFEAWKQDRLLGRAIIVEEIGKHRPITFVVGIDGRGRVADVAVMAYREAYGGEIRHRRFLAQFRGKRAEDSLRSPAEIRNIAGATLSVRAAARAVKKALALASLLAEEPARAAGGQP